MKRSVWTRILALVLVLCMLSPVTVSAAGGRGGAGSGSSASSAFQGLMDWLRGRIQIPGTQTPAETEAEETEAPETEAVETQPAETENTASGSEYEVMTAIEDETTVLNGDMLRASTYAVTSYDVDGQASTSTTVYYPVTLYDYDTDAINAATHQVEVDAALAAGTTLSAWNGLYFNEGAPSLYSYSYTTSASTHTNLTWAEVINGTYYADEACTSKVTVTAKTESTESYTVATVYCSNLLNQNNDSWTATNYYYYSTDGDTTYYRLYAKRSGNKYYTYTWGYSTTNSSSNVTEIGTQSVSKNSTGSTSPNITVYSYGSTSTTTGYTLTNAAGSTLATLSGTDTTKTVGVTLYSAAGTASTGSIPYAPHNVWTNKIFDAEDSTDYDFGKLGIRTTNYNNQCSPSRAGYIYSGLVKSKLSSDGNKDVVFTVPEGGIFNSDPSVKDIYTNVGLPFTYDEAAHSYTFDSATLSAKFDGNPASNTKLVSSTDGEFWPFYSSSESDKWHFGMKATVPFTMTPNGKLSAKDDSSDDIVFNFSGDDDVWVFIDGVLVLDIGGIHNSVSGSINFAENARSVFSTSTNISSGYINTADGAVTGVITGYLFDEYDEDGTLVKDGVLDMTIETFAATDDHELTVFYLERGEGVSNCKISFNLPVKDTLSVTKQVEKAADIDADGNLIAYDLSVDQLAVINNMDFGFTLYDGNNKAVANATYSLMNADGQVIATPSTDSNGHFTLKNGQTAKFVTEFSTDGDSYYVVEDIKNGFIYTGYSYSGAATNGITATSENSTHNYGDRTSSMDENAHYYITNLEYNSTANGKTYNGVASDVYTVKGGSEAEDSLTIVAKNYLNYTLPTPTALPDDDIIVIDYGLSVVVELTSNDYFLGNSYEIAFNSNVKTDETYTGTYGTFTYADGKITYTLDKQLTGVEVIEYTVTAIAVDSEGNEYTDDGTAKVYIIPATTMYYEEDFTGLVTYNNGKSTGWSAEGIPETDPQEPGVVGTVGDSPYGSDVAYLHDSGDSNGSSMHVSTTEGAAQFKYTFTGTGTSFYARTTNNTGYMKIVVSDKDGNTLNTCYRDTYYAVDSTILYNIPVFTYEAENYGTYTVTVTIAKEKTGTVTYHSDFWLDGIRVYQPLDTTDGNYSVATSAYASDAEANMTNVTLRTKLLSTVTYEEVEREVAVQRVDENGDPVYKEAVDEEGNTVQLPVYDNVTELVTVPVWPEDGSFVLFTDSDGAIQTAEEYKSIGPKEEVYVYDSQSVSFSLENWDPNTNKLYLGIKAPTGSGTVTIGSTTLTINNAADCYYDISSYGTVTEVDGVKVVTFKITSGAGSLISLTNIKVTGNAEFTIVPGTNEEVDGNEAEG